MAGEGERDGTEYIVHEQGRTAGYVHETGEFCDLVLSSLPSSGVCILHFISKCNFLLCR